MLNKFSNSIVFIRWVIKSQKRLILFFLVLLFLQTSLFIWSVYEHSIPIYIQLYEENKVADPPQLNEKYFRENEVITWTQELLIKTFSWNYHNWKDSFNKIRPFYSEDAFKAFLNGVKDTLDSIQNQRGTLLCRIEEIPRIRKHGVVNGIYQWEMNVPLALSFENYGKINTIKTEVTIIINRQFLKTSENPTEGYKDNLTGLLVEQIVMKVKQ